MSKTPDINDTLRTEGVDGVRARHDKAHRYKGDQQRGDQRHGKDDQQHGNNDDQQRDNAWHFYSGAEPPPPRWLIKSILPETGSGILAGQWGVYKTTIALDLSVSVMTGIAFADRYRVSRKGGVVFIALEGAGLLARRLRAVATARGVEDALPFAWRDTCPPLTAADAPGMICALVEQAAKEIKQRFNLPLVLIFVDTIIAAAGYGGTGDDNDAAAAQKVMGALAEVSRRTGALVMGVDHFGKMVDTGTRGSSAKEGAADVVLAALADREIGGALTSTKMAIRKQRDGIAGLEIPFTPRVIETGTDQDGDPITQVVVDWSEPQKPSATAKGKPVWTTSALKLLRKVLMAISVEVGQEIRPFVDGPVVRACKIEAVRTEFYKQHPAEGDAKQKAETRRKAFNRTMEAAQGRELVVCREIDGDQWVWLAAKEEPPPSQAG